MIKHIVMWTFPDDTQEQQTEFINGIKGLYNVIDGIQQLTINKNCNPKCNNDLVLEITFDSMDDLNAYQVDPRHLQVAQIARAIATSRADIDYIVEE